MTENERSKEIIVAAIEVHKAMKGPGRLEDVYEESRGKDAGLRGVRVERPPNVPLAYKRFRLARPLTLDVPVDGKVMVERKAAKELHPVFEPPWPTYLRLTGLKPGRLINFGETLASQGIRRVVNGL